MYDELTRIDIEKMQEELRYRRLELQPKIIEEVQRTRAFGDLSENYEYKAAKQEQRRNTARIRYLENMIKTAKIIDDTAADDEVGLFDKVTIWLEEDEEEQVIQVVTTVRCDPSKGFISKESPLGKAILGKKVGDSVTVKVSDDYSYTLTIRKLEPGSDTGEAPLMQY
ncbi:MAG: transcription elongation factor GreA [Oscillospiraceae bacterium]|nr:transcription elongation factor GreA [Oscillospiraceae bacterium]